MACCFTIIAAIILSITAANVELRTLLAKYWFLNYGDPFSRNFIFPDLDYGFSIAELQQFHSASWFWKPLTSVGGGKKPFDGNRLSYLPPKVFSNLTSLEGLNLANNRITNLEPGVFDGINPNCDISIQSNQLKIDDWLGQFKNLRW